MVAQQIAEVEKQPPVVPLRAYLVQLYMVLIVSLGTFLVGCSLGWVSPALQELRSPDSLIKLSSDDEAKLAIYPEIGHFAIPTLAGFAADRLGRKVVFIIITLLALTGWSIKYFTDSLNMLLIARLLLGFQFGAQLTMMNIYAAEITSKNVRGTFGSITFMAMNVGILFMFVIGNSFSLKTIALVSALIAVLHLILLVFLLESPYYLAKREYPKAEKVLRSLRGASASRVASELSTISKRTSGKIDLSAPSLKSFGLCLVLAFLCDVTGRGAVIAYATQNFSSEKYFSAGTFTILLGAVNAVFPLISTALTDKVGRKIMILVGGTVGGAMHFSSGLLYYLHTAGVEVPLYSWLLFVTITGFLCSSSVCLGNVLLVRGELIAENNRGLASGLVSTVFALGILTAIKMFQVLRDYFGLEYSFWMLSGNCFAFVIVAALFLPETKGKSFEEIQRIFGRK